MSPAVAFHDEARLEALEARDFYAARNPAAAAAFTAEIEHAIDAIGEAPERYEHDPDARLRANQLSMGKKFIELYPELTVDVRLDDARSMLRRVLTRRGLATITEEDARIDACTDLVTLGRWLDNAVTASSAADALR